MNRSLGGLRINKSKKDNKQPDYLGRMILTKDTLFEIIERYNKSKSEKLELGLAGWNNKKQLRFGSGEYVDNFLTIEIRTLRQNDQAFYKPNIEEEPLSNLEQFFN